MAKVRELLTEEEMKIFERMPFFNFDPEEEVKNLRLEQLSDMAMALMKSEYNLKMDDICPAGILSSQAITILTSRAIESNIAIF